MGTQGFKYYRSVLGGSMDSDLLTTLTGDAEFEAGVREDRDDSAGAGTTTALVDDARRDTLHLGETAQDGHDLGRCLGERGMSAAAFAFHARSIANVTESQRSHRCEGETFAQGRVI